MRTKTVISFGVLLGTILLAGCATQLTSVKKDAADKQAAADSKDKAEQYFILARDAERRGLNEESVLLYEKAYEFDKSSAVLRRELVRKYLEASKFDQALLLVKGDRNIAKLSPDDKRLVATIYLKMGDFEKAAEVMETVPNRTEDETYSLGLIYESLGNPEKALKRYEEYFHAHPSSEPMGLKLGRLYIHERQFDDAESLYTDLEQRFGANSEISGMKGVLASEKGDTADALGLFGKALGLDSSNEEAMRNVAQIYLQRNDYAHAIPYYETLYKSSYYTDIYGRTLAVLYYYDNRLKDAETLLKEQLKANIDDYELHYYLGMVFALTDRNDLANIELEKAVTLQSTFEDAWREICSIAVRTKNMDAAKDAAQRCVNALPHSAGAWRIQGYVLANDKEYAKAAEALRKAVQLDSTDSYAWFDLGSTCERNKDVGGAALAFRKVLTLNPGDASASNYLGYMWAEHDMKLDSAKILIEAALKKEPGNAAYLDSYAWISYQMGKIDTAYSYMRKAVAKLNNDPVIYSHLGDILNSRGDFKGALDAYRKCIEFNADDSDVIRQKIISLQSALGGNK